jgi:tetratricopeptide (TPR) repeat protein
MFKARRRLTVYLVAAVGALVTAGFFPMSLASAQNQREIDWCEGKDGAIGPLQIKACDAVIRSAPPGTNLEGAFAHRGWAYFRIGDFDRAIADENEAIRLNPKNAGYFSLRCDMYRKKNEYSRAMADCFQAISLDSKYTVAFFVLA